MTTDKRERRALAVGELRADEPTGEGEPVTITGYAAVFNAPTDIGDAFREVIAPGAFAASIARDDIRALIDHDPSRVIGRNRARTLKLEEDAKGLRVEISLPDTQIARDLATSMRRGDIDGMSFGFYSKHDEWDETTEPPTRTLHELELFDVSVVTFPAYPEAGAALRSLTALRDAGLTAIRRAARMRMGLRLRDRPES